MNRKSYRTDLTNEQWNLLKPMLPPPASRGRKRKVGLRQVINAIFYLVHTGCQWRNLPHELLPGRPSMATSADLNCLSKSIKDCERECAKQKAASAHFSRPVCTISGAIITASFGL